jgi:NAD+ kinase
MRIYAIVAKPNHPLAAPLIDEAVSFFTRINAPFITDDETAMHYNSSDSLKGAKKIVSRNELTEQASTIVVLGGDGTLISVCRHPSKNPPDIIGVNLGTLGFLTEITPDELQSTLEAYEEERSRTEKRPLLLVEVLSNSTKNKLYALNDIVISKQALARIFGLRLSVNGEEATLIRGDGIIISTPGGSTAYSLAAGGSIVHPGVDALLVTPICPHSLTSRPLVVPGNTLIDIELGLDCRTDSVYLTVDGQEGLPLTQGACINISKSTFHVSFVKSLTKNYFGILSNKLRWGQG